MKKSASEIITNLEMRVARLERQSSTSTLSNESKSMMLALANHSRKTPMPKKGNFNIFQEVLEALGFNFEMKQALNRYDDFISYTAREDFERVSKNLKRPFNANFIDVPSTDYEEALPECEEMEKKIQKAISYIDYVDRKPKKPIFGRVSLVRDGHMTVRGGVTKFTYESYVGVKKVIISKNGKKVTLTISPYKLDLENFDLTKITRFVVKEGATEDAKNFLNYAPQAEEPELTLEEQNKGTCCFCGAIVAKRKDGKLFKHGYRIFGWTESAPCYGSFEFPIETSPEGLKSVKKKLKRDVLEFESRGVAGDRRVQEQRERSIVRLKELIAQLDQRIRSWKPQV